MVLHPEYPCLGARSVFNRDRATVVVLEELATGRSPRALVEALATFGRDDRPGRPASPPSSPSSGPRTSRTRSLRAACCGASSSCSTRPTTQPWDPAVSDDPANPHFAFSVAGTALLRRGPAPPGLAHRPAHARCPRWSSTCTSSSRSCASSDRFDRMRDTIRRRDARAAGLDSTPWSPTTAHSSEARQYSGRRVPDAGTPRPASTTGDRDEHADRATTTAWHRRPAPASCCAPGRPLTVIDPTGGQVSDLFCFAADDHDEWLSSGRTIDYANSIYLTTGTRPLQQPQPRRCSPSSRTPAVATTSC